MAAAALATGSIPSLRPRHAAPATAKRIPSPAIAPPHYAFLSPDDAAFIEAAVERLIPADEHGPGARQAGAVIYIDRCLQVGWQNTDRLYRNRFWHAGRLIDTYRLPETPGALFRHALRGIEDDLAPRSETAAAAGSQQRSARARFGRLPAPFQDAYLRGLQTDIRSLDGVPSWLFLEFLFTLTVEAFFGDPAISGNEDTVALNQSLPATPAAGVIPFHHDRSRRLA